MCGRDCKKKKRFAKPVSQVARSVHALQSALLITASLVGLMLVHWPPVDPSALKPLPDFSIEDNTLKKKSTKFQRRVGTVMRRCNPRSLAQSQRGQSFTPLGPSGGDKIRHSVSLTSDSSRPHSRWNLQLFALHCRK